MLLIDNTAMSRDGNIQTGTPTAQPVGLNEKEEKSLKTNLDTEEDSEDVVDYIPMSIKPIENKNDIEQSTEKFNKEINGHRVAVQRYGDCEVRTCVKQSLSSLDRLQRRIHKTFPTRKKSDPTNDHTKIIRERTKFVKSASIAKLLGNNYNTKKAAEVQQQQQHQQGSTTDTMSNSVQKLSVNGDRERFKTLGHFESYNDDELVRDLCDPRPNERDLSAKAIRTITRGIGRLLRRRSHSVDISTPDPEFKVSYLGNVLTGWAKGDGCVEKPLSTLWRNYIQNSKPDVLMRVRVCPSGLKATTKQHGLTEYWSHRITHCCSPKNYPRIFCWIYRHEGRKLKHELRCHAVLCGKESIAQEISTKLHENLQRALHEFKRDKLSRQNARLSLVNSVYENPSIPRRKILLSVGGNNYRPPLERSKSAPKLGSIEEIIDEEEDFDEDGDCDKTNRTRRRENSLDTAMTLGRRRSRRMASMRRQSSVARAAVLNRSMGLALTAQQKIYENKLNTKVNLINKENSNDNNNNINNDKDSKVDDENNNNNKRDNTDNDNMKQLTTSDDDFDKLLLVNNYDKDEPLVGELMSLFDMKLNKQTNYLKTTSSLSNLNDLENENNINLHETQSMDNLDNDLSLLNSNNHDDDDDDEDDDCYFNQDEVLDLLITQSIINNKIIEEDIDDLDNDNINLINNKISNLKIELNTLFESDDSSLSSGCDTSSTTTTTTTTSLTEIINLNTDNSIVILEPVGEKTKHPGIEGKTMLKRSVTLPITASILTTAASADDGDNINDYNHIIINKNLINNNIQNIINKHNENNKNINNNNNNFDSDSEFSDESGYVEYQDNNNNKNNDNNNNENDNKNDILNSLNKSVLV